MVFGQTFGAGVKQDHPRRGSLGWSLRVTLPSGTIADMGSLAGATPRVGPIGHDGVMPSRLVNGLRVVMRSGRVVDLPDARSYEQTATGHLVVTVDSGMDVVYQPGEWRYTESTE